MTRPEPELEPGEVKAPAEPPIAAPEARDAGLDPRGVPDDVAAGPSEAAAPSEAAIPIAEPDPNGLDAARDPEARPVPVAPEGWLARWTPVLPSLSRSAALGALLGLGALLWFRFNFSARWVSDMLIKNTLDMPDRMRLIAGMVLASAIGGLSALAVSVVAERRGGRSREVERFLWFLSPLVLLPVVPLFFRYKPWKGRLDALLPATLAAALVLEILTRHSLLSAPGRIKQMFVDLRDRLPQIVKRHGPLVVVVGFALFYALFFSFYTVQWHHKIRTGNFDLGINNNLMFGGLHGAFLESRIVFPKDPAKYLANHAKIGTYAFLPIYALFPRAETLLVLQSTLLGLGSLPLFLFARKRIGEWLAAIVALCYLCYYPMHAANFYEVNHIPIAAPFIVATVWALDARRWVWFAVCFLLGSLMREDIPIGMAVIGTFLLLSGYRPWIGLGMAVVSTLWFAFLRFYVMDQAGDWWFPDMYKELFAPGEKGFSSVLKTLITNPFFVLWKIIEKEKLWYLMHLFVPLAFLPVRRWWLWFAFVPGGLMTLLATNYKPLTMYSFQYVMHWTPYLFLALVLMLEVLGKIAGDGRVRQLAAATALAFATLVTTYNAGAFPRRNTLRAGYNAADFTYSDEERKRYAQLRELIALIPPEASLATTERVGVHASSRKVFYSLRRGHYRADYLLAAANELELDRTKVHLGSALKGGEYGVVKRLGNMAVMKRGHDRSANQQLIDDWKL